MAELGNIITLSDRIKRQDPDGKIADIVNLLEQSNDVLKDAHYKEGNRTVGEQYTQIVSLPTPSFRKYNEGAAVSKVTTAQVTEACGLLEDWSRVDEKLVELEADPAGFRMSESMGHLEGMAQKMASTIFYGNSATTPEEFTGFAPRYNSLTGNVADNVLSGGGAGADNSSIWLIGWGPRSTYLFYPKGSTVGLTHKDWGKRPYNETTGMASATLAVYEDQFQWEAGLANKDWRYNVRICNIDISALTSKSSAAAIIDLMIKAIHRVPNLSAVRPVFYCNRSVFQMLDIQAKDQMGGTNDTATVGTNYGAGLNPASTRPVRSFRGIPVRLVDALTETEAVIS